LGDYQPRRLEERLIRELGLTAVLLLIALIQTTLLVSPAGFSVPMVLIVAMIRTMIGMESAAADAGIVRGLVWALYGGLGLDVCAASPLGSHALAALIGVLTAALLLRRLEFERPLVALSAVLIATVIYEAVLVLILQPQLTDWAAYARLVLIPGALVTLVPTLPTVAVMRWLLRRQD
jgi:cell shape-determining protein MreD